jgi:6-pyruvoyltetrahydropterin/6-carboxytetrahydropterin synthase
MSRAKALKVKSPPSGMAVMVSSRGKRCRPRAAPPLHAQVRVSFRRRQPGEEGGEDAALRLRQDQLAQVAPDRLLARDPERLLGLRVPERHETGAVERDHRVQRRCRGWSGRGRRWSGGARPLARKRSRLYASVRAGGPQGTFTNNWIRSNLGCSMRLGITEYIDCAHFLPGHPKCGQVHGHTYKVEVVIEGESDRGGMVVDFNDLKTRTREVLQKYDHRHWNDVLEFPTVENICALLSGSSRSTSRSRS